MLLIRSQWHGFKAACDRIVSACRATLGPLILTGIVLSCAASAQDTASSPNRVKTSSGVADKQSKRKFPSVSGQVLVAEAYAIDIKDGDYVTEWMDSSPNAATGTAVSGHEAPYSAKGINGRPAVNTSYGNPLHGSVLIEFPDINAYHSLKSETIFAVVLFKGEPNNTPEYFFYKGPPDSFQHCMFGFAQANKNTMLGGFQNTNDNNTLQAPASYLHCCDGAPHLLAYVYDATAQSASVYVDGMLSGYATEVKAMPATDATHPFVIGGSTPKNPPQTCLVGTVALFNRAIAGGSADFMTIQQYLVDEYGLKLPKAATTYSVTPPASMRGPAGAASGAYAVTINGAIGKPVTITPSCPNGAFTPSSLTFLPNDADAPAAQTFTFTPTAPKAHTISFSNTSLLSDAEKLTYTATAPK